MKSEPRCAGLETAFRLWAKTDRASNRWHALPYHLVDVGSAAAALWRKLPWASKALAIDAFGNEDAACRCVIFLSAIHDIGKANRFFQQKDARQAERLRDLGVISADEHRKHGEATTALLSPWLSVRWGWRDKSANGIAIAVGGHHGCFRQDLVCERLELGKGYVPEVSHAILESISRLFVLPTALSEPKNLGRFVAWLAGFVSVADWLGSHNDMNVWRDDPGDLREYSEEALVRAESLLDNLKFSGPVTSDALTIGSLIPAGSNPNHLQHVAGEVATLDFGLAIVEAPTGEGKTEAAFALCERGRSEGGGVFFALPTMATANGIFDRVNEYVRTATGIPDIDSRLLHSQAWLYREDPGTTANVDDPEYQSEVEDWFAGGKRGLLAPYSAGTIDQALVGALRAKHGFVRLFALAGKTIVVDEIHAYDVYMSDLLERLLEWLRALGCRVILLSATLPASRRQALIKAWGGKDLDEAAFYPSITWVDAASETRSRSIRTAPRKPVSFELLPQLHVDPWIDGADKILELVDAHDGFGAIVLNTVKDAQSAYRYLKKMARPEVCVDLFHARFSLEDRKSKEDMVLTAYGKEGPRNGPRILVATQVVEQSLDLDFDHMVTALAPIDLLIQRAGRLHRHRRTYDGELQCCNTPDLRPNPTIFVIEPKSDVEGVVDIEDWVYAHDVLMKTHALLQASFVINEPSDVATAVSAVYDNSSQESDRAAWQTRYDKASAKADAKRVGHHEKAKEVMICKPVGLELITGKPTGFDENDAPESHLAAMTRLEDHLSANLIIVTANDTWPPESYDRAVKRFLALRTVRTPVYGSSLQELRDIPMPPNWDRSGYSKYAIPITLNDQGRFETATYRFTYNQEMGLTIEKRHD